MSREPGAVSRCVLHWPFSALAAKLQFEGVVSILAPKQVNSTRGSVDIHPYVQGRMRALPRQDETSGILLGSVEDGVIRVTGFKRVTPGGLRLAALESGPALVGFYRLQTSAQPTLLADELELWRQSHPYGHSVFLLVKAVGGEVEATAWTRDGDGEAVAETVSLNGEFVERRKAPSGEVLRVRMERPTLPRRILLYASLALVAAVVVLLMQPDKPARSLALELQSRGNELTAIWNQQVAPEVELQFATLSILDGSKEQTMDLTRNYTPRGQITIRPQDRDVVFTLRVKYAGEPLLSRGATYTGFVPEAPARPAAPQAVAAPANPELESLRKRNRELEEAVAALKKHFLPRP